jgi:hypothetical protein
VDRPSWPREPAQKNGLTARAFKQNNVVMKNRFSKLEHSTRENVFRASEEFTRKKINLSGQTGLAPHRGEVIAQLHLQTYIAMRYK